MALSSEAYEKLVKEITDKVKGELDNPMRKVKLIAGRSNPDLASRISVELKTPLTKTDIKNFANTETFVKIDTVRGCDVFIIGPGGSYEGRSIDVHCMELFQLIGACRANGAEKIHVISPFYPYARSDKHDESGTCIVGSLYAEILERLGVSRIISVDLHAGQEQGFFRRPFDNIYAINEHITHLEKTLFAGLSIEERNKQYILCSPDLGGIKRCEAWAKKLKMKHVLLHKHRNYEVPGTVLDSKLVGSQEEIKGRKVITMDDMCDSFGTSLAGARELMGYGAVGIIVIATHGIFSGEAIDRINNNECIEQVIVTNTLPQVENCQKSKKLQVIDIAPLLAKVIRCVQSGESISKIFK